MPCKSRKSAIGWRNSAVKRLMARAYSRVALPLPPLIKQVSKLSTHSVVKSRKQITTIIIRSFTFNSSSACAKFSGNGALLNDNVKRASQRARGCNASLWVRPKGRATPAHLFHRDLLRRAIPRRSVPPTLDRLRLPLECIAALTVPFFFFFFFLKC